MSVKTAAQKAKHVQSVRRSQLNNYEKYRAAQRKHSRLRRRRNREEAIKAYGGKCKCCGEKELLFLTIDHVDGKGAAHRRELKRLGATFFHWLRQNKYPKGLFQVLCWNCNCARHHNDGVCPHKVKEEI